jgi:hypothetical protein
VPYKTATATATASAQDNTAGRSARPVTMPEGRRDSQMEIAIEEVTVPSKGRIKPDITIGRWLGFTSGTTATHLRSWSTGTVHA